MSNKITGSPKEVNSETILVRGKYKIISKIGQGQFGIVFKAVNIQSKGDKDNNDTVAIKVENTNYRILKHETTILNYLNKNKCKNIPLVHWFGLFDRIPCLVTPFYHYGLSQFIMDMNHHDEQSKIAQIDRLMQNMLDILKNCHELFVIHRDIKPDNFMFNYNNELVLLDFGLATFTDTDEEYQIRETKFIGNIIYASPNIHKCKKAGKIDDVISIAYIYLLIYLGGKLPWMGIDRIESSQIINLKEIQNIHLCQTKDNKIFHFIENAYNDKLSYIF